MWVVMDGSMCNLKFMREFTKETEHNMQMQTCKIKIVKKNNKPL